MTCFCDVNCPIVVKSSSIEMSGGNLVIMTPLVNLANMPNLQKIDLILCQCLPSDAGTAQVYLSDGTNTVPVNVETGNYLHADQLKCRRCYHMIYGDNPAHVSLRCSVPRTSFAPAAAAAPTSGSK